MHLLDILDSQRKDNVSNFYLYLKFFSRFVKEAKFLFDNDLVEHKSYQLCFGVPINYSRQTMTFEDISRYLFNIFTHTFDIFDTGDE